MNQTEIFEAERPRLVRIASRVLGDKSMGWYRDTKRAFAALPDD